MSQYLEFRHGALSDPYEKQVNKQGFTYGDKADFVEKLGWGLVTAHIHGLFTEAEYDKILRKFQQKILVNKRFLKRLEVEDE